MLNTFPDSLFHIHTNNKLTTFLSFLSSNHFENCLTTVFPVLFTESMGLCVCDCVCVSVCWSVCLCPDGEKIVNHEMPSKCATRTARHRLGL